MPNGRGVRFVLLSEDERFECFVRKYLYSLGVRVSEIRPHTAPEGEGSGKQWIDLNYPGEVKAYRQYARENRALIVATEADQQTVRHRVQWLDNVLKEAGLAPRSQHEKIAILIPRWHIETWLLHLSGHAVDEDTYYKKQVRDLGIDIKAAAQEFLRRRRDPDSGRNLPSILAAFEELKRIQEALDQAKT